MNGAPAFPNAPFRWTRLPVIKGDLIVREDGEIIPLEREFTTAQTARILRMSKRHIQAMCDQGIHLVEGRDWRKVAQFGSKGRYRIKISAVERLARPLGLSVPDA